jgi:3-hydroxyacyl-CoA dehydrogenase
LNGEMPNKILWAWERAEDLRFIDTKKIGVAFLAQTLLLNTDEVMFRPRRQPLKVSPETYLIAVTRIETTKHKNQRPQLSDEQKNKLVALIKKTLELPDVKAVQIDFDVVVSERNFYRRLISELKKELPENTPLTITALASWCIGDTWY